MRATRPAAQRRLGECRIAADDHHLKGFAEPFVRQAEGERRGDAFMTEENVFDLQGRDLVAAARDNVLRAADEFDAAVIAQAREIAGAKIDRRRRPVREWRIVEIAEHAERRADLQFARAGGTGRNAVRAMRKSTPSVGGRSCRAPGWSAGVEAEIAGAGFGEAIEIVDGGGCEARMVSASVGASTSPPVMIGRSSGASALFGE